MPTSLPMISAAGLFHSKNQFCDPERYPEHSITKMRTVMHYELELFTEDGGTAHLNGNSYPIKKGSFLIAQPGDKRQSTLHFSTLYLHFTTTDEAIQELIHSICGFHSGADYEMLAGPLKNISDTALCFEPDSDISAAAMLISLLCEIRKICFTNPASTTEHLGYSVSSRAVAYMKQHYSEPLTVGQIADYCCISAPYFYKIFRETAHATPNQYLLKIRLAAAKSLLVSTALSVSEIAEQCGFHSQAYFSDCFKRHFGITAREFRSSFRYP
ncbi:MAG TPA: AraC family transcriptional regulator [Candidatus Eisenbergiella merdipullorum]|uniref:AraC family transcriptional regulator n=1 Tax=Candidatus Eisenbergiella merdipullorum TaxID=2838553 RepID=A0A9D2KZ45_9FIRM|nr:AraC family transcriptional regulator [Candidatus Eisenbergiella merdipullorum]